MSNRDQILDYLKNPNSGNNNNKAQNFLDRFKGD